MSSDLSARNGTAGTKKEMIFTLIAEFTGKDVRALPAESRLRDDVGLDSFAVVELLYELEMKLSIRVSDSMLKELVTLRDLFRLVDQVQIPRT